MNEEERKVRSLLDYTFDRLEEELSGSRGQRDQPPAPGTRGDHRQRAGTEEETGEHKKAHP